jgi:hypothetical protein
MDMQRYLSCSLIFVGALIMLVSMVRVKGLARLMPFAPERRRSPLYFYLLLHRGLIVFFFFGYVVVLGALAMDSYSISQIGLGIILLLGAVFVFTVVTVQMRLLLDVQKTLQGILPICACCKKIRVEGGDPRDRRAWKAVESYISEKTDVGFSHGLCPECLEIELNKIGGVAQSAAESETP